MEMFLQVKVCHQRLINPLQQNHNVYNPDRNFCLDWLCPS
jgi:hypothetical protein